jgi:hypothetical protein
MRVDLSWSHCEDKVSWIGDMIMHFVLLNV